ncbi:MAG: ABC transporter permease [Cyanobacteria bacterium]|nr:ABC transporter permease [Cyanobacteriota bacterium]MDW8199836.1 ABC transporter permease [Cyanobacteriota bacterium SKYGB_h_bin112]
MKIIMGNITAIYRKELQSYFASPLAYGIAGVFWLLTGIFFAWILQRDIAFAQQGVFQGQAVDVPTLVLQDFLGTTGFISLFILPILSMGLYAEERKQGTLELLATSPITNWAVALGKLLGVVTFFVTMLVPVYTYVTIVLLASTPPFPPGVMLLGYASLILMAAATLSLGMFVSSLTSSTLLAGVLSFALVFGLWVLEIVAQGLTGSLGEILRHLSLLKHYANLLQGILDTSSLLMFGTYMVLGVFLTAQSIEALRFQRS